MKKIVFIVLILSFLNCESDDNNDNQTDPISCCGENPFESTNINNLNQTIGEIETIGFFTPNGDTIYDYWIVDNLELYSNFSLEIFNSNDESIFFSTDSSWFPEQSGNGVIEEGVYRYKIIVENEQTFFKQGYFCSILNIETELSTANCVDQFQLQDPIIDNN